MPTTIGSSFSSVRTAFNTEGYGIAGNLAAYRRGSGIVPNTSEFNVIGGPGQGLALSQFVGFTVPSLVTFTPPGGATAGTAVFTNSDEPYGQAEVIISCTQNATWTYTKTLDSGNGNEFVSLASGGVATSITFTLDSLPGWPFQLSRRTYSLSATSGGITQYWTVDLRSDYT